MPATRNRPKPPRAKSHAELAVGFGACPTIELHCTEWSVLLQLVAIWCRDRQLEQYWQDLPATCARIKAALPTALSADAPRLPFAAVVGAWHGAACICSSIQWDPKRDAKMRAAAGRVGHAIVVQLSAQTTGVR